MLWLDDGGCSKGLTDALSEGKDRSSGAERLVNDTFT